jgi:hypothetical protein
MRGAEGLIFWTGFGTCDHNGREESTIAHNVLAVRRRVEVPIVIIEYWIASASFESTNSSDQFRGPAQKLNSYPLFVEPQAAASANYLGTLEVWPFPAFWQVVPVHQMVHDVN